jgi:ribulose-phosphate 3-epimerase
MYAKAGADHISIHPESTPHIHRSLMLIKELGCKPGLAINPGTAISVIEPVIDMLDIVLIMSVNPGFYGQKFIDSVLQKVKTANALRKTYQQNFKIVVDGGINSKNSKQLISAGADVLVAGNSVFKQPNYFDAIKKLKA